LADSACADNPANKDEKNSIQDSLDNINKLLAEVEEKAAVARKAQRTEIFISYAHTDSFYKKELELQLKAMSFYSDIKWWDDSKIKSGEEWNEEIHKALDKAKIAILMVSAGFLGSDYVQREELPKILEAADKDGATILWIPTSTCYYEDSGIAKYHAVGKPELPLDLMPTQGERNVVYKEVLKRIKEIYKTSAGV
jgi:internalin A